MKEENCSKEERFSFEMVWVIPKLREAQVFISISENSKETPYTFFCKFGDGQKIAKISNLLKGLFDHPKLIA